MGAKMMAGSGDGEGSGGQKRVLVILPFPFPLSPYSLARCSLFLSLLFLAVKSKSTAPGDLQISSLPGGSHHKLALFLTFVRPTGSVQVSKPVTLPILFLRL